MFRTLTKKQKEVEKEAKENGTTTKQNAMAFSYTVTRPLIRRQEGFSFSWTVMEKGSEKTNPGQRYEISYNRIKSAASQIRKHILRTPCHQSVRLFNDKGFNIYLKKELYQITDSVKARGVIYTLLQLSDKQKRKGVIAISTGSFAFILCHYGYKFKIPVTVVLPISTAHEKIDMCQQYANSKTRVLIQGRNMLEAHNVALDIAKANDLFYLDGNDHPNIIIGQATLGLEIMQECTRKIDAVVLPTTIDGCGLTTGIAMAIKGWNSRIKVIEVQTSVVDPVIHVRRQTTLPCELEIPLKEYTACPLRDLPRSLIDRVILIGQTWVHAAAEHLLNTECYTDSYGAIALAAILAGQLDELKGKRVVVPLFGRIDSTNELSTNEQRLISRASSSSLLQ